MTQTRNPYAKLFLLNEKQRKHELFVMASAFSLKTDYNNDLLLGYDTIQACLQHDRHFNPSQAEISLALFGASRLSYWLSEFEANFPNHELILHWEWQGLLNLRFLGYSFYLFPKVDAVAASDLYEDDEFPLAQEHIDTIEGPFVDWRGNNNQTMLDWMFEEVRSEQNSHYFNQRKKLTKADIAKLSKPAHHKPLSEILKGVLS